MTLEEILQKSNSHLLEQNNIQVQKSNLKFYSKRNWIEFCKTNDFDGNSNGVYIPKSKTAYLDVSNEFFKNNILHEYFGHGLFFEHSVLADENYQNKYFGLLGDRVQNIEGFAMFLEKKLSNEIGEKKLFDEKMNKMPKEHNQLLDFFVQFEKQFENLYLISQMGFPKYYNSDKLASLLNKIYKCPREIDFAILCGSKKPLSDIDIFIISQKGPTTCYFNGWLDIYEINREEFNQNKNFFDISLNQPLFEGDLILGDKDELGRIKEDIKKSRITQKAISYNKERIKEQKKLERESKNKREIELHKSYIKSYKFVLESLLKGKEVFSLEKIVK